MDTENTLLPWVDYLAYCKPHGNPVVGHQLGFLFADPVLPGNLIVTRKAMCDRCLQELWSPSPTSPPELPETPVS